MASARIPVIYCTDLFHPHDDPDDHFDLACLYALSEMDVKAIILDQGRKQEERPGQTPIAQMNHLTGRTVPYAIGLAEPLAHPEDTGEDQPQPYQAGVNTLLTILRESADPVTAIAVGSLRDIAAAYNREPELLETRISRLYVFIGEAQAAFQEYNAALDIHAYRRIMNAPLPVYWTPCFDGGIWENKGNASFWQARHDTLLADVSTPVLNFFIHALLHKQEDHPKEALVAPLLQEEKERVLGEQRNLWCCAVFPYMAGRVYVRRGEGYLAVPPKAVAADDLIVEPFSYQPVRVCITEDGKESYLQDPATHAIHRFRVTDNAAYAELMTSVTRELLKELSYQHSR